MNVNEYQILARRTLPNVVSSLELEHHALHGMVSEIGEIHSIYQKTYQGHPMDHGHIMKELGDLMWFIAEFCTAKGWKLNDICEMNIEKLKQRYPEGFKKDRSLCRDENDI